MAYLMRSKIDRTLRRRTQATLRKGARMQDPITKEPIPTSQIISMLDEKGLTYRRTNMLRDIRRARAIELSHTSEDRIRAMRWYDEVFETFQKKHNLTPKEASRLWRVSVEESWTTLDEAEKGADFWELYNLAF